MIQKFFSTCPRGLEEVLADELLELGASQIVPDEGGVHFSGDKALCYTVNLKSRIAGRVYWILLEDNYYSEEDVYENAFSIDWSEWFDVDKTIKVKMVGRRCPLKSLNFAGLKVKDAICDKFRTVTDIRPSVDTHSPDMIIHGFLSENRMILSLDTSGEPLFKRGMRKFTNEAPIRENLASGILRRCGWKPGIPLYDPMCGSGTFLLEAALQTLNVAPGIDRKFAFEKFNYFSADIWNKIKAKALKEEKDVEQVAIYGSDIDPVAIKITNMNLESLGLKDSVSVKMIDFIETSAPAEKGILITNLPYGERLSNVEQMKELYPKIGDKLKKNFAGWDAFLLTSDLKMPKSIRLSVSRRIPLFNGALECRLFHYKMIKGSNRKS